MTVSDREVLDVLSAGILVANLDEVVHYANPAARGYLGRTADACRGQSLSTLLGLSIPLREHTLDAQGELRLVIEVRGDALGVTVILLPGRGYACIFRRVDQGRGADSRLVKIERHAAMIAMINMFAHEVRNPLASIQATVEYLRSELSPDDSRQEHLRRIERQIGRLARLADGPLALGRLATSQRVACDVRELVTVAVEAVSRRSSAQAVAIRVAIEPDLPRAVVDEHDVAEALTELLGSAMSESAIGVAVSASAITTGDRGSPWVVIAIKDQLAGRAADSDEYPPVVRPHYPARRGAAGVGVALAERFILASGGRLAITPRPGAGPQFQVELPAEVRA